jgi:hypothetical protein
VRVFITAIVPSFRGGKRTQHARRGRLLAALVVMR